MEYSDAVYNEAIVTLIEDIHYSNVSEDFIGKNYTAVIPQIKAIGFENIETVDLNDTRPRSS